MSHQLSLKTLWHSRDILFIGDIQLQPLWTVDASVLLLCSCSLEELFIINNIDNIIISKIL